MKNFTVLQERNGKMVVLQERNGKMVEVTLDPNDHIAQVMVEMTKPDEEVGIFRLFLRHIDREKDREKQRQYVQDMKDNGDYDKLPKDEQSMVDIFK